MSYKLLTENLNVRDLLDLLAERIGDVQHGLFIAMNDADNDGNKSEADYVEAQHNLLGNARQHIGQAIEAINSYHILNIGDGDHETLSTSLTRIMGEGGYEFTTGDGWINITPKGEITNIEFNVQFAQEKDTWQSFEYAYLTATYNMGDGDTTIDLELGGEHDAYDLLAITKSIFAYEDD